MLDNVWRCQAETGHQRQYRTGGLTEAASLLVHRQNANCVPFTSHDPKRIGRQASQA